MNQTTKFVPCSRGHTVQRFPSGGCPECCKQHKSYNQKLNPIPLKLEDLSEQAKREVRSADLAKLYLGRPCKYEHSGLRYIKGKRCVVCSREDARQHMGEYLPRRKADDPEFYQNYLNYHRNYRRESYTPHASMVYVIFSPGLKLYKIGITTCLARRLDSLRTANPGIFLAESYVGDRKLEKFLHRELARYRVDGEWFDISDLSDVTSLVRVFNDCS